MFFETKKYHKNAVFLVKASEVFDFEIFARSLQK